MGRKKRLKWPLFWFCIVFCISGSGAVFAETGRKAPLNPEFLEYRRSASGIPDANTLAASSRMPTGWIPSPVDLSHVLPPTSMEDPGKDRVLPPSYDLRDYGYVTSVKDQNPYGTCWAFGAMASLESSLLKAGKGTKDLSEWHLAYFAYKDAGDMLTGFTQSRLGVYFDPVFDQGGEAWMSTAILSRWTGAVDEAERPYQNTRPWPEGAAPLSSDPVSVHLENVLYLGGTIDEKALKNAIMTYGAVVVSIKWDDVNYSPYNETYASFYVPSATAMGGHSVTLAGWNDDFSRYNFNTPAPSNGAWLVKNSWGEKWGDGGYFWLSYCDPNIKAPAVFLGNDSGNFERIYQYDPLGWTGNFAPVPSETAWFANVFQASGSSGSDAAEVLKAVSFYAGASNAVYRVEVWTDLFLTSGSPRKGVLAAEKEGTFAAAGYHTVRFPDIPLQNGSRFAVVVRLTTPGYRYPVPVEMPIAGYSEKAIAAGGQSFVSSDGKNWSDITVSLPGTNVCIKAFTSDIEKETPPPPPPSDPGTGSEGGGGGCSAAGTSPLVLALAIPLLFLFRKQTKK